MAKRIVIATVGQPSTNPRMFKEYMALKAAGYEVKVLYAYNVPWAAKADKKLFEDYGISEKDFILVGGSPEKDKQTYLLSRIIKKLADKYFPTSIFAISRASYWLFRQVPHHKADLYIAHTLGALPSVIRAARKNGVKAGFDAEDFHRGEMTMGKSIAAKNTRIEQQYFPKVDYFTAASPMITDQYRKLYPGIPGECVNNYFPRRFLQQPATVHAGAPLKLWWFSQKIGRGRGLEDVISAMGRLNNKNVQLTLLGNITDEMRGYLAEQMKTQNLDEGQLTILEPVAENELYRIGSNYDIGLALETGKSENLQYCLANKIFSYLLSGNAIIFSDTPAQRQFWEANKNIGGLYERDRIDQLAAILQQYMDDSSLLQQHRNAARSAAETTYNWEKESEKLLSFVRRFV